MKARGAKKAAQNLGLDIDIIQRGMQPAHKAAAIQLFGWIQKNFDAEGKLHDKSSLHWPKLKPATVAGRRKGKSKAKAFGSGQDAGGRTRNEKGQFASRVKILQDTGRLKGGFDVTANPKRGRVENRVRYSVIHEGGWPAKKIPQRKMYPTIKQGKKIAIPAYQKFFERKMK